MAVLCNTTLAISQINSQYEEHCHKQDELVFYYFVSNTFMLILVYKTPVVPIILMIREQELGLDKAS